MKNYIPKSQEELEEFENFEKAYEEDSDKCEKIFDKWSEKKQDNYITWSAYRIYKPIEKQTFRNSI